MRILLIVLGLAAMAAGQTTQPAADATIDWLLSEAAPATRPATEPTTRAVSPFAPRVDEGAVRATITFSDGSSVNGTVTTTPGKPIRIWDEARGEYRDVPLELIRSFAAEVLWERDQPEWKFIESGSDIKEMTGRTYPARELIYTVTLVNDQQIKGGVVAPLYFQAEDGARRTLVLHKRQKGEVGQTLAELRYLKSVELGGRRSSQ